MKKSIYTAVSVVISISLLALLLHTREDRALAAAPRTVPEWKKIFVRHIDQPLTYAGFISRDRGITVGVHGLVYYTENAGRSWKESLNQSACRHGLDIIDDTHAWHCGNRSVRRSVDSGKTWTEASDFGEAEPLHARFISFADEKEGIIATDVKAAVTDDGGLSWKIIQLPQDVIEIAALSASYEGNDRSGSERTPIFRIMDQKGNIRISRDGCATWTEMTSPATGMNPVIMADAPTSAMRFNADGNGLISFFSTSGGTIRPYVFRTTDGGKTWTGEHFPQCNTGTLFISPDLTLITYIPGMKRSLSVFTITH
ncbi:MAG TPA: hypothetical protein PKK43_10095 [Spirochaetota bacterium]|nr:hypothetical protein [Spirochaetota bacterium]